MTRLGRDATRAWNVMVGPPADLPNVSGSRPELGTLSAGELAALLARTYGPPLWEGNVAAVHMVFEIRKAAAVQCPLFSGSDCDDLLVWLVDRGGDATAREQGQLVAAEAILRCQDDLGAAGLQAAARLAQSPAEDNPIARLVLAATAGPHVDTEVLAETQAQLQGHPLALAELDLIRPLSGPARAVLSELPIHNAMAPPPDLDLRLLSLAGYAAGGRAGLESAVARADAIASGTVPYAADQAFSGREVAALARITRVALARDEPWIGALLQELLPRVTVAPTAAKTLPSQAACVKLTAEIVDRPTPEAVEAIAAARRVVRHATVTKKLDRALRAARPALAQRPTIALRLPPGPPSKTRLRLWTAALEAGLALGAELPYATLAAMVSAQPEVRLLVATLVWNLDVPAGPIAAMLRPTGDAVMCALDGQPIALAPDAAARLWHPATASPAERSAWRDRIIADRIRQPFRQVFREHYEIPAHEPESMFAGYVVALKPFLGIARREGWHLDNSAGTIHRDVGPWRMTFRVLGSLFPGADGTARTEDLRLTVIDGAQRRERGLSDAPSPLTSELLRSIDLLVSASSIAVLPDASTTHDAQFDLSGPVAVAATAALRREALERVLTDLVTRGVVTIKARHVTVSGHAVHLATARVTRNGDPVTLELPKRSRTIPMPWLPYDEKLLAQIVHTIQAILALSASD